MNYENPELLDRLAAEYVLGTLRGQARRRVERLCEVNVAARAALHRWENDFMPLSRSLKPIKPSARVWTEVQRRTIGASGSTTRVSAGWRQWRFAAAAAFLALGLIVGLLVREQTVPLQTVAMLGTDATHPLWHIERAKELKALSINVVGPVQLAADKSYELWALPRGGKPVSLGLLPRSGKLERTLTDPQRVAFLAADKIAVSVEPAGGSKTGAPTGPVVIVSPVAAVG